MDINVLNFSFYKKRTAVITRSRALFVIRLRQNATAFSSMRCFVFLKLRAGVLFGIFIKYCSSGAAIFEKITLLKSMGNKSCAGF